MEISKAEETKNTELNQAAQDAETTQTSQATTEAAQTLEAASNPAPENKLFTQEELDRIIGQRLKREEKRGALEMEALQKEKQELLKELNEAKMLNEAFKRGLDEDSAQYAVYQAGKLEAEGLNFNEAMERVIKENQFLKKTNVKTGLKQSGKLSREDEAAAKLAGILGVKI